MARQTVRAAGEMRRSGPGKWEMSTTKCGRSSRTGDDGCDTSLGMSPSTGTSAPRRVALALHHTITPPCPQLTDVTISGVPVKPGETHSWKVITFIFPPFGPDDLTPEPKEEKRPLSASWPVGIHTSSQQTALRHQAAPAGLGRGRWGPPRVAF